MKSESSSVPPDTHAWVSDLINHFGSKLSDPTKPLTLLVRFQVQPGTQMRFETAFREARRATRSEQGVLAYDLNRTSDNPLGFVVYERWNSLAALEAHLRTPYIARFIQETNDVLDGVPDFQVLLPIAIEPRQTDE